MTYLQIIVLIFNIVSCIPSAASITKFDYWWIRGFDFPRIQISVLLLANIILALSVYDFMELWPYFMMLALILSLLYQLVLIFPYTYLAKKQVKNYGSQADEDMISILVSNVLMTNDKYHKILDLVKLRDPDILLTLETNKKWEDALSSLDSSYHYCVKIPLDNLYGMHLYSKLPLENTEIKYLITDEIPSIHGKIVLPNGHKICFHCLHPKPPSPTESKTSTNRDAELLLVGKEIKNDSDLVLVFGDLNDVAWSRTTKVFQKLSGLMDPRRGRGFFNTYNANHQLLRWPLDHVFHSDNFTLVAISRECNIGSDHFPMYIKLNYTPAAKSEQKELNIDMEEREWAESKIHKANPQEENLK